MKLAMDVHHHNEGGATAAAVAFDAWDAFEPLRTFSTRIAHVEPKPRGGQLDLRDLPCMLQLLREHALTPELIVINGTVHLDAQESPGLGQHLFHALGGQIAIVGISKTAVPGLPAQFELVREDEARPLIISSAGIDLGAAKARVRGMHGKRRVPTLMKLVARLAKNCTD